jgi:DnaJ family protein C protein 28
MDRKPRGVDEIIQQAMQEGAFDNLPGKGKPLNLEENPYLDSEWQLAYHLLKQNGFAPDFVEQRQHIELELAETRAGLARAWAWRQRQLAEGKATDWVEGEWQRAHKEFADAIKELNVRIREYNTIIPTQSMFKAPVNIDIEIKRLTA